MFIVTFQGKAGLSEVANFVCNIYIINVSTLSTLSCGHFVYADEIILL